MLPCLIWISILLFCIKCFFANAYTVSPVIRHVNKVNPVQDHHFLETNLLRTRHNIVKDSASMGVLENIADRTSDPRGCGPQVAGLHLEAGPSFVSLRAILERACNDSGHYNDRSGVTCSVLPTRTTFRICSGSL